MFVEFEEGGGVFEFAALVIDTVGLDVAERFEGFLELAREALALDAEVGEEAMGVDDVELDLGGRLAARVRRSASRSGMRLRRQEVSAISLTS